MRLFHPTELDQALPSQAQSFIAKLSVPDEQIVLLQAFFECYEGVAVVRTERRDERSQIEVITTYSMREVAETILNNLEVVDWKEWSSHA